jgi:hypothetical protein
MGATRNKKWKMEKRAGWDFRDIFIGFRIRGLFSGDLHVSTRDVECWNLFVAGGSNLGTNSQRARDARAAGGGANESPHADPQVI